MGLDAVLKSKKPFLNVAVVVSISSQFSQVLSLVLPHIERRCGRRNGLKLGMLLSRHQKLREYKLPGVWDTEVCFQAQVNWTYPCNSSKSAK